MIPGGSARPSAPGSTPCTPWPLAGRRLLAVHAFLFAAASDAELETAAQAHEAQARQLRDPAVRAALRGAWQVVDPLRFIPAAMTWARRWSTCWNWPRPSWPGGPAPSCGRPASTPTPSAGRPPGPLLGEARRGAHHRAGVDATRTVGGPSAA